jgi:O-antigen/teichoic acid export membrane protein
MFRAPDNPPLTANFLWFLAGVVIYTFCQWVVIITLTKFASVTDVGHYTLALAINAPLALLTRLHLRTVLATDIKDTHCFGEYLGLRLLTITVAPMVLLIVLPIARYDFETLAMILLITAARTFESVSDIYYGLLQKHEKLKLISISMILRSVGSLVVFAVIVIAWGEVLIGVIAYTVVWGLVLLFFDIPISSKLLSTIDPRGNQQPMSPKIRRNFVPVWNPTSLRQLLFVTAPLGISVTVYSLSTNIPKYVLEAYHGSRPLGIFAAMVYLILAGGLIVNALGQVATPRLAAHFANGNTRGFNLLLAKSIAAGCIVGVTGLLIASLFGKEVLTILYSEEYAAHADILVLVILAGALGFVASLLGVGVAATRQFLRMAVPYLGVGVVAVISSMMLIPAHGMRGAAWALFIVNAATVGCLLYILLTTRAAKCALPSEVSSS